MLAMAGIAAAATCCTVPITVVPNLTICGSNGAKPFIIPSRSGFTVCAPWASPPKTFESTGPMDSAKLPSRVSAPSTTGVTWVITLSRAGMATSANLEMVDIRVVPSFWTVGIFFMITEANLPLMERVTLPTSSFMSPQAFAICWILPWSVWARAALTPPTFCCRISARTAARCSALPIFRACSCASVNVIPTLDRALVWPCMTLPIMLPMATASSWLAFRPFCWASRSVMPPARVAISFSDSWKVASCCIPARVTSSPITPICCSSLATPISFSLACAAAPAPLAWMLATLPRTASSLVSASICALASSVLPLNRAVRPAAAAADTAPTPMAAALVTWAKPLPIADRACAPLVTTLTTGVATIFPTALT